MLDPARPPGPEPAPAVARARPILRRLALHLACLLVAVVAFGAYEHYKLQGRGGVSVACLAAAGGFGFAPVRALLHEVFAIEGKLLHLLHGFGGLAVLGLALAGFISGAPVLSHGALAPFAVMAAAQAIMHQDHPRTPEQAEALRRFATSLPEVRQFTASGDLTSPANVRRAVVVLTDLISKAEALGETELRSDPGFQAALRRATTRLGLSLGLDAADQAIGRLAASPAAAGAVPQLKRKLAAARKAVDGG